MIPCYLNRLNIADIKLHLGVFSSGEKPRLIVETGSIFDHVRFRILVCTVTQCQAVLYVREVHKGSE
jgi:hypothetical protein